MWVRFLGGEDPLEKEMATYSCTLGWEIPCTKGLGGLQSIGSQIFGQDWSNWAYTQFSSVQSLSPGPLFVTPWTAALQASLSITNSRSLLKLMPIKSVMPFNHLILCHPFSSCPQPFPASGSFPMSQFFPSGGQSIGASASALVLLMNIQDWIPLGLTGWISLQSRDSSKEHLHLEKPLGNAYISKIRQFLINI